MKKIILSILAILLLLMAISLFAGMRYFNNMWFGERPKYSDFTTDLKAIPFIWSEDTYGDFVEKQSALLIPIQLEGVSQTLYLQFDTGAPNTLIYGNTLTSLKEMGLVFSTTKKDEKQFVEEINFKMGESEIRASNLEILGNYGNTFDPNDTTGIIHLGTIGADFLVQKITAIDFKNQLIQQYEERQDWMTQGTSFQTFGFKGRRIMLPGEIGGKKRDLFYDSGTSAFGLMTNKWEYSRYGDANAKEILLDANGWGSSLPIRHKASDEMMKIGGLVLPLKWVSYIDMYTNLQVMVGPFTPIGGWLGNKPFTEHCLILDAKTSEFVVVKR